MGKKPISLNGKTVLVTGSPGFIGANLVIRLLREMTGGLVISYDNMNAYYDPQLKVYRLGLIEQMAKNAKTGHIFIKGSISGKEKVEDLFKRYRPDIVVNLAGQAGVRYSIEDPGSFVDSNIIGFFNILEACRRFGTEHLVYASSSSVYGGNTKVPFSTEDNTDRPVSFYAATKKSNELMAHAYSKLYDIPATGLRFFTVYGPAGRPDMFYYSAAEKLVKGEKIRLYNYGNMSRDFTYIDDIVEGIYRVMKGAPERHTGEDGLPVAPHAVYNIGGGNPEHLTDFIRTLHESLIEYGALPEGHDLQAYIELTGMQKGDVPVTYADSDALEKDYGFVPETGIKEGLRSFAKWYAAARFS